MDEIKQETERHPIQYTMMKNITSQQINQQKAKGRQEEINLMASRKCSSFILRISSLFSLPNKSTRQKQLPVVKQ